MISDIHFRVETMEEIREATPLIDQPLSGIDADLELFPDLHELNKSSSLRMPATIGGSMYDINHCTETEEDELISFLTRESVPTPPVSPPCLVSTVNNLNKEIQSQRQRPAPKIKVVTLKQGVSRNGQIYIVNDKNAINTPLEVHTTHRSNRSESHSGPSSPVSSNGDFDNQNGQLCMSKNAIAARENRLRKKHNVERLEKIVNELTDENSSLKGEVSGMNKDIASLRNEVNYLRAVLANQSTIARLLKKIPTSEFNISSSDLTSENSFSDKQAVVTVENESEEECDCHPDKNVCMCTKENITDRESKKLYKNDHSYANGIKKRTSSNYSDEEPQPKKRIMTTRSSARQEPSGGSAGVCLHVSGDSVSLEFCSTCSSKAASSRK